MIMHVRVFAFILTVILSLYFRSSSQAQNYDDCFFYKALIDAIKERHDKQNYTWVPEHGNLDPINPDSLIRIELKSNRGLRFYVVDESTKIGIKMLPFFWKSFTNDTTLVNQTYSYHSCQCLKRDSTFEHSNLQILPKKAAWAIDLNSYYRYFIDELGQEDSILYTPLRIQFAELLYNTRDNIVVLFAVEKRGIGTGGRSIWSAIFERRTREDQWQMTFTGRSSR